MFIITKKDSDEHYGPFKKYEDTIEYAKYLVKGFKFTINGNVLTVLDYTNSKSALANKNKSSGVGFALDVYPKESTKFVINELKEPVKEAA